MDPRVEELYEQLGWHWEAQLRPRLDGLTDDELWWEPARNCWTVELVEERWVPHPAWPPVEPPPFTTIGWRLCHIADVLGARASYHFGDRSWSVDSVTWPGSAKDALGFVDESFGSWRRGVEAMSPSRLDEKSEGPPQTLDGQFPFSQVILHVNREVIHHGAEVAVLRDLYRLR
ncbi:MAG: DinB family protein [Actinomycetota bacterium]